MVDDWPGRIVYDAMMVQSCAYLLIPFQLYLLIYLSIEEVAANESVGEELTVVASPCMGFPPSHS